MTAGLWATSPIAFGFVLAGLAVLARRAVPPVRERFRCHWSEALALATPLAALLVLRGRIAGSWWSGDDPCWLLGVAKSRLADVFWRPEVWRPLSGSFFTPWLPLSLGIDWRLFGPDSSAFFAHQLAAYSVFVVAFYLLARSFLSPLAAATAAVLTVLSSPSLALVGDLSSRHYVEGAIWALAAAALFVCAARRDRWEPAAAGGLAMLLAASAKEVFVPLVALLPFLPVGSPRRRLRHAIPYFGAVLLYGLWRLYMVGSANLWSGYLEAAAPQASPLAAALRRFGIDAGWAPWVVAGGLLVALVAARRRLGPRWPLAALLAAVLLIPLFPVWSRLAPRHLFLPALAVALVVGRGVERAGRAGVWGRVLIPLLLVLLGAGLLASSSTWRSKPERSARYRAEGAFILDSEQDGTLVTSLAHTHFLGCLTELRETVLGRAGGPRFCADLSLCPEAPGSSSLWRLQGGEIRPMTPAPAPARGVDAPLEARFDYDGERGRVRWALGPYDDEEGSYRIHLVFGAEGRSLGPPIAVPARGEVPMTLRDPLRLRAAFRSREGWQASSPVITVDPRPAERSSRAGRGR